MGIRVKDIAITLQKNVAMIFLYNYNIVLVQCVFSQWLTSFFIFLKRRPVYISSSRNLRFAIHAIENPAATPRRVRGVKRRTSRWQNVKGQTGQRSSYLAKLFLVRCFHPVEWHAFPGEAVSVCQRPFHTADMWHSGRTPLYTVLLLRRPHIHATSRGDRILDSQRRQI